jgi:glycosyltransferase involved in cell wall biosynthesis
MSRAILRRFGVLGRVRKFDVVLVAREASLIGPAVIERLITWLGVPMVYDFDDPLWMPYRSPRNHVFSRLKCFGKTRTLCRMATQVIAGNRLLADWAKAFSANVHVVPSTIDIDRYPAAHRASGRSPVTLGWTGSHSTLPFLERLHRPLARLSETHRFRLMVVSHTDAYQIPDAPYEVVSRRWSAEREVRDLQAFDIGLAPFPGTGWTPWRCHGKVLQYMAAAACVVASPIGILPDMIRPGESGFFAESDDEWVSTLARLIDDESLRLTVGHCGRRFVENSFASEEWALAVKDILEAAARSGRHPASRQTKETSNAIVAQGADGM